jgi:hypothetical protein
LTESESGLGAGSVAGGDGGDGGEEGALGFRADGEAATIFEDGGASGGTSKPAGGDSMICAVELKYRARFGRRNVGGSADTGIRMSRMGFRNDLLNILMIRVINHQLGVTTI